MRKIICFLLLSGMFLGRTDENVKRTIVILNGREAYLDSFNRPDKPVEYVTNAVNAVNAVNVDIDEDLRLAQQHKEPLAELITNVTALEAEVVDLFLPVRKPMFVLDPTRTVVMYNGRYIYKDTMDNPFPVVIPDEAVKYRIPEPLNTLMALPEPTGGMVYNSTPFSRGIPVNHSVICTTG